MAQVKVHPRSRAADKAKAVAAKSKTTQRKKKDHRDRKQHWISVCRALQLHLADHPEQETMTRNEMALVAKRNYERELAAETNVLAQNDLKFCISQISADDLPCPDLRDRLAVVNLRQWDSRNVGLIDSLPRVRVGLGCED